MEREQILRILPILCELSRLGYVLDEEQGVGLSGEKSFGTNGENGVEQSTEKIVEGLARIVQLFEKLDEIKDLPDDYLVHPTSDSLRSEVFAPENREQREILNLVPRLSGPFIQSPLVIDDDS